jgi:hydroxymethylbilane synthase
MRLRVGTRGSELALWQTRWVCARLQAAHPGLHVEEVIIKTHGDIVTEANFGRDWPVGAFVAALENALLDHTVDFAVHSYKDLPTQETPGLVIAATPERETVHDVLLTRVPITAVSDLPPGARIGTNSPRRATQLRQVRPFEIVPIRGNVPTRVAKLARENLDGVVLAAAGLKRLGIVHPHALTLPVETFLPAAAQGALALQTRADDPARAVVGVLENHETRRAVVAERMVLRRINAGCHTPVAAFATVRDGQIELRAKLFTDDWQRMAEGVEHGTDPVLLGSRLAERLYAELHGSLPPA